MLSLDEISKHFEKVTMMGDKFRCCCPCHKDDRPSCLVSINTDKNGKEWVNAYCLAGCEKDEMSRALNGLGLNQHEKKKRNKIFKDDQGRTFLNFKPTKKTPGVLDFAYQVMRDCGINDLDSVYIYKDLYKPIWSSLMVRYLKPDGTKTFKIYTWWTDKNKEIHLLNKGWPEGMKRPLFFASSLDKDDRPTLCFIHEGEKKAKAGFKNIKNEVKAIHVSWPFGVQGVDKADWSSLQGLGIKEFILLPDNDEPGRTAMSKVAKIVSKFGKVSIVDTTIFPEKFDIGDLTNNGGSMRYENKQPGKETEIIYHGKFKGEENLKHFQTLMGQMEDRKPYEPPKEPEPREFAYIEGMERFYDLKHKQWNTEKGFNNIMAPITQELRHSNTFHMNPDSIRAQKITFDPKVKQQIFTKDGTTYLNDYEDPKPKRVKGDITKFLNHLAYLVPDELNREYLIKWIAYKIQNPGKKMMCSILMMSEVEGVGKTTIFKMMRHCLGYDYATQVQQKQVMSQFNDWAVNKLLIGVEEIAIKGNYEERSTNMDIFKFLITEDTLNINLKNEKNYVIPNLIDCLFFSNNPQPITLTPWSRRFWVWKVEASAKTKDYYIDLYDWFENKDGYAMCYDYFLEYEIKDFYPHKEPPKTKYFWELVDRTANPLHQELDTLLESNSWPFTDKSNLVSPQHLEKALQQIGIKKINKNVLADWLRKNGYGKVAQIDWINEQRPTIWAKDKEAWLNIKPKELAQYYLQPVFEYPENYFFLDSNQAKTVMAKVSTENLVNTNQLN